jgi:hypothetical protein
MPMKRYKSEQIVTPAAAGGSGNREWKTTPQAFKEAEVTVQT